MKTKPGPKTTHATACKRGSLSLPADWWETIKAVARKRQTSVSGLIRQILGQGIGTGRLDGKALFLTNAEAHELHNILATRVDALTDYEIQADDRKLAMAMLNQVCELTGLPNDYENEGGSNE